MHRPPSGFHPIAPRGPESAGAVSARPRPPWPLRLKRWAALLLWPATLVATEQATTAFPNGAEDFLVAAMPPPGVYAWLTFNEYSADRVADDSGNMPVASFDLRVNALVPRLDWVKPVSLFGADRWGTLVVVPALDLDLALSPVPGVSVHGNQRGWGDLTIGNGLHWTFAHFDMVNAFDVTVPSGAYDAADVISPGQNRWVVRLSTMGTWRPAPTWDVSYRFHWDYNFENADTDYHSGQTLYLNWAVGRNPRPPLTIGVVGYFLRQVTDDQQHGQTVGPDGNRLRVDGIGPGIKYFLPNHVMLTAKYFREFNARNHPEGGHFWLQVTVPFGGGPK
jgi:hypothetical protein